MSDDDFAFGGSWDPADPKGKVRICVVMTEEQAMALAQLAKRCTDVSFAVQAVDASEARLMYETMGGPVRDALFDEGFGPR